MRGVFATTPIRHLLSCLLLTSSGAQVGPRYGLRPVLRSWRGRLCRCKCRPGAAPDELLRKLSQRRLVVGEQARRQPATRCNWAPQDQTNCEQIGDAALADGFHETYDDFARYSRLIRIVLLSLSTVNDRRSRHHLSAGTRLASTTLRRTTIGGCTSSPPCGCGSSASPSGSRGGGTPLHRPGFEQAALPARLCSAHLPRLQPRPVCEAGPGPVRAASTPRHLAASVG